MPGQEPDEDDFSTSGSNLLSNSQVIKLMVSVNTMHTMLDSVIDNQKDMKAAILETGQRVRVLEQSISERSAAFADVAQLKIEVKANSEWQSRATASWNAMAKVSGVTATLIVIMTGIVALIVRHG